MNVDPIPVPEYWPVADFDAVRCLRVVAAMTPGAAIHEAVLHSPLEEVWATALDFAGKAGHRTAATPGRHRCPGRPRT